MVFLGYCLDFFSILGFEDFCIEISLSFRDKVIILLLLESIVFFSNGVLKGELLDLGVEDGWIMDVEVDYLGGFDRNSMDFVDSCCSFKKIESF